MTAFFQITPGAFHPTPLLLATGGEAFQVVADDIDGDGDVDVATGRFTLNRADVALFWGGR